MTMKLLTTNSDTNQTAMSFTSSIDSTYKLYVFKFYDINPATDTAEFTWNGSTDGGSNYNVSKTSAFTGAYGNEAGDSTAHFYEDTPSKNNNTAYQELVLSLGNGSDESCAGELWLFDPSSTTFAKHYWSLGQEYHGGNYSQQNYCGGYLNTTSAINAISFKMDSGNFDGTVKMYGAA